MSAVVVGGCFAGYFFEIPYHSKKTKDEGGPELRKLHEAWRTAQSISIKMRVCLPWMCWQDSPRYQALVMVAHTLLV